MLNINCFAVEFHVTNAKNNLQQHARVNSKISRGTQLFLPCHKCSRHVIGYVEPKPDDTQDVEGRRMLRRFEARWRPVGDESEKEGERGRGESTHLETIE